MKKIKLFALALAATFSMGATAQTTLFHWQYDGSETAPAYQSSLTATGGTLVIDGKEKELSVESVGYAEGVPETMKISSGKKALKLGTSDIYLHITTTETLQAGDIVEICGYNPFGLAKTVAANTKIENDGLDLAASIETGSSKSAHAIGTFTLPEGFSGTEIGVRRVSSSCGVSAIRIVRPVSTPHVASYTIAGVEATIDNNALTITAELPFGTDKAAAIEAATVAYGGGATSHEYNADKTQLTVTDGTTPATYTLNITVSATARSEKEILDLFLSNGTRAWEGASENEAGDALVFDGKIEGYYLEGAEVPTVSEANLSDGATYKVEGEKIIVTAEDNSTKEYSFSLSPVAPLAFTADPIVFDGTEKYIKSGYNYSDSKGWRFAKNVRDAKDRVRAGQTSLFFFLPACQTVTLTSATSARDIKVLINNQEVSGAPTKTAGADESIEINVAQSKAFILEIRSNQTGGDGGFSGIQLTAYGSTSALENVAAEVKATKVIENGQLVIIRDGVRYNALGAQL